MSIEDAVAVCMAFYSISPAEAAGMPWPAFEWLLGARDKAAKLNGTIT